MASAPAPAPRHTNRLAKEESPYLLQHAHNPVDWYPWGKEAFDRAKAEDKPLFLSVGYSTCHWCHVMERESFESEATARVMNESFINVKVDREERPDVDRVYMTYVQAATGSGGWPMSVWLTPELEPIVGGTYFPPEDAFGRPGFRTVLRKVAAAWAGQRGALRAQGADVLASIAEIAGAQVAGEADCGPQAGFSATDAKRAIARGWQQLARGFDPQNGGFSGPPKFPRVSELNLALLRASVAAAEGARADAAEALHAAELTLDRMAAGGIRDHLGGGFSRYSVDELWHVPHFEKMLYDNPQIAATYLDAFRATGGPRHARVARDVLDYLLRDMRHPGGGFYSAEDADSLDAHTGAKKEGAFYVWSEAEVDAVLGPGSAAAALFKRHYGVQRAGNATRSRLRPPGQQPGMPALGPACRTPALARCSASGARRQRARQLQHDAAAPAGRSMLAIAPGSRQLTRQRAPPRSDPHSEFVGKNVLLAASPTEGPEAQQQEAALASARRKLWERRGERARPHLDDKVVTAWNGLAIGALAAASQALRAEQPPPPPRFPVEGREPGEYLQAAVQAAEFVQAELWDPATQRLARSFRTGRSAAPGVDSDYAFLIAGLLELHAAGGEPRWLAWALQLQQAMDGLFWDGERGGYFSTTGEDASIRLRLKEGQDGAEPAASSVAIANLARLAALTGPQQGPAFAARAAAAAAAFAGRLEEAPVALTQMCCSLFLLAAGHLRQVLIAGRKDAPDTAALVAAAHAVYCPDKVVLLIDAADAEHVAFWERTNPQALAMARGSQGDGATAFVCQNFACQAPTTDAEQLRALLRKPAAAFASRSSRQAPLDLGKAPGVGR